MSHEMLNLAQAAAHVHLEPNDLKHAAQRGEIAATNRGGDWFFDHAALDEWAQRHLLAASPKELRSQHSAMLREQRLAHREGWGVADLFSVEAMDLALTSKARAGILRDLTDLADSTGHVYDVDGLYRELVAREEAAPTAIGEGVALPHPRIHDPYMFEQTFVVYGRSERPVFFGAPEGEGTRHFFLVCSTDHELHLHILARLAILAHGTDLLERLDLVATPEEALTVIAGCESEFRK